MFEFFPETRAGQQTVIRVPDDVEYVAVGDSDRLLPRQFEVVLWPDDTETTPAHVATFAMIDGRPVCVGAGAQMVTPNYREVRPADLRAIRVQDMLDHAVEYLAAKRTTPEPFGWAIGPDATGGSREAVRQSRRRVNDDLLRRVAATYEANLDGAPVAEVEAEFDVSRRTASLYVKKAREAGFITRMKREGEVF